MLSVFVVVEILGFYTVVCFVVSKGARCCKVWDEVNNKRVMVSVRKRDNQSFVRASILLFPVCQRLCLFFFFVVLMHVFSRIFMTVMTVTRGDILEVSWESKC